MHSETLNNKHYKAAKEEDSGPLISKESSLWSNLSHCLKYQLDLMQITYIYKLIIWARWAKYVNLKIFEMNVLPENGSSLPTLMLTGFFFVRMFIYFFKYVFSHTVKSII